MPETVNDGEDNASAAEAAESASFFENSKMKMILEEDQDSFISTNTTKSSSRKLDDFEDIERTTAATIQSKSPKLIVIEEDALANSYFEGFEATTAEQREHPHTMPAKNEKHEFSFNNNLFELA